MDLPAVVSRGQSRPAKRTRTPLPSVLSASSSMQPSSASTCARLRISLEGVVWGSRSGLQWWAGRHPSPVAHTVLCCVPHRGPHRALLCNALWPTPCSAV